MGNTPSSCYLFDFFPLPHDESSGDVYMTIDF